MSTFELGLLLMTIGMATVFAILWLVIGLGKALIALVNKYAPEQATVKSGHGTKNGNGNIPSEPVAVAIVSAVSVLTAGRGKVIKIEQ